MGYDTTKVEKLKIGTKDLNKLLDEVKKVFKLYWTKRKKLDIWLENKPITLDNTCKTSQLY